MSKLTEADLEAFWSLRLRALRDNPEAFGSTYEETLARGESSLLHRLRQEGDAFSLGAFDGDTLAATVRFDREQGHKERHKAYVYGMYVAPESRGHGLGKSLMRELISFARKLEGQEQLHLAVVTTNDAAFQLYRSLGFDVYGTVVRALKLDEHYWDEYLMVLHLL